MNDPASSSLLLFSLLIGLLTWAGGTARGDTHAPPLDVSAVTAGSARYHDTTVSVRGLVVSAGREGARFVDLVPLSGSGDGLLVTARGGAVAFPADSVGKVATVRGTFFCRVYPRDRMRYWRDHGWRVGEGDLPAFAKLFRMEADSVEFSEPEGEGGRGERKTQTVSGEKLLEPYTSHVFPLDATEFEAAGMGTGRKCLAPGAATPAHTTGRYHELVFVLEGELTVELEGGDGEEKVAAGSAVYIPPKTRHHVRNRGSGRACYIFVYSKP